MKTLDLWMLSFNNLHKMAGRATPEKLGDYKLALRLYKVFKNQIPTQDWVNLNYNIIIKANKFHDCKNKPVEDRDEPHLKQILLP